MDLKKINCYTLIDSLAKSISNPIALKKLKEIKNILKEENFELVG